MGSSGVVAEEVSVSRRFKQYRPALETHIGSCLRSHGFVGINTNPTVESIVARCLTPPIKEHDMSTRQTRKNWKIRGRTIHVYRDLLDDRMYIEITGRSFDLNIRLPHWLCRVIWRE